MKLSAAWTNDCQGKKDYDGRIVSVSTRYWPQGGGFWMFEPGKGMNTNPRPEIKPSANSSILIWHGDPETGEYITLTEKEFEGESFEQVRAEVEAWAQTKFEEVADVLKRHFDIRRLA